VWRLSALLGLLAIVAQAQTDAIAELGKAIEAGNLQPGFDDEQGYLPWLLRVLDIPDESQMLVFSKTSVQALLIEPSNPRRLYFNDSVIVGNVKGGPIEIAAQDPVRGMVFYLLDQHTFRYREFLAQGKPSSPFVKRTDCMTCHLSRSTGLPETLIRSVVTDRKGNPRDPHDQRTTDGRTPFDQLWGGWFVTGKAIGRHMGNVVYSPEGIAAHVKSPEPSDVAALMVFEHQMRMMNLIAWVGTEARRNGRVTAAVNELVDYMLFVNEARLPERLEGGSGFAEQFAARGPQDEKGRSLRDLDLETRLQRYLCSYMIYSDAFDALPASAKTAVYRRMMQVLATRSEPERRAVLEILRDTKPDFTQAVRAVASR
jgi:hypothetical protein